MHDSIPLSPNQKSSLSIRRNLILLLLGLQLFTVLIIIAISHFTLSNDVKAQSNIIIENAVKESKAHALGFLEPAYRNALQTSDFIEKGLLDVNNEDQTESFFLSLLEKNPEFNGAYVTNLAGDFFFVSRNTDVNNSSYLTKKIKATTPGVADFLWRDDSLDVVSSRPGFPDNYNAKERPWYQQAMNKGDIIWTEPYVFFTSKEPGITVAIPYRNSEGGIEGAIGLDIALKELSKFFSELKVYGSSSAFMVSANDKFIAAPSFGDKDTALSNLDVSDTSTGQPIERYAANFLAENLLSDNNTATNGEFYFQGSEYSLHYDYFSVKDGPEWIIGAYAPSNTFLEVLEGRDKRNISFALFVLFLSLIIGFYYIKRTWQPFDKLVSLIVVDEQTGLYNRHFLQGIGSNMYLKMLRENNTLLSIALIDIDNFSAVNSEFGSHIGDKAITKFAEFLRSNITKGEVITRYSGDRFVIILSGADKDTAEFRLNDIRLKLDSWPLTVDDLLIRLTFSAGIVTIDDTHDAIDEEKSFETFIAQAKEVLEEAKSQGRDRVVAKDLSQPNVKKIHNRNMPEKESA